MSSFDLVVVGATPGGITTALAAARRGHSVLLLERSAHIGGLPANGLGATDIGTRGATAGLFLEFVNRIKQHYVQTYGPDSQQVKDSSDGYHFEPHIAEKIFLAMLAEHPRITTKTLRQFDADKSNLALTGDRLTTITVTNRETNTTETYTGQFFIDATYEGDLAAAAGVPYTTRREGFAEFHEPMSGKIYKPWGGPPADGSTGEGDDTLQAYNYRLCLTDDPAIRVTIQKPAAYNREEFASLADDIRLTRYAGTFTKERHFNPPGIGRITNQVILPNHKTDSNNQHLAFISTDLPEENYPWPTADWAWRDRFADRLRSYTLGLLYFAQNDPALPEDFRQRCAAWGLARDEYIDNANFPRQVYVREGRRIVGRHLFTAHDALPTDGKDGRPPIHADSITASHYALDSHAHHKREPGRAHLDGFFSFSTKPCTVPYGVIVPKSGPTNLLCPVPVSGTHVGFSTLRMEPCWMALGQAAGIAASLALTQKTTAASVAIADLQNALLDSGAVLIYFQDASPADPNFKDLQRAALRGEIKNWHARQR